MNTISIKFTRRKLSWCIFRKMHTFPADALEMMNIVFIDILIELVHIILKKFIIWSMVVLFRIPYLFTLIHVRVGM